MNQEPDIEQPDNQRTYIPAPKQETIKVWLLTIILHLIIALSLLAYWHFFYQPKAQQPIVQQPTIASTPMKTTAVIASLVASTTIAPTTLASITKASAPKIASQPNGKPLPNPPTATGKIPTPIPSSKTIPTPIPIPAPQTTTTTTITKKEVYEAPVTQALTDRDLPSGEKTKNAVATAEHNKEANELSEDIDAKNKELSNLINQVRKQNQQKIDKEAQSPFAQQTENVTKTEQPKIEKKTEEPAKPKTENQEKPKETETKTEENTQ